MTGRSSSAAEGRSRSPNELRTEAARAALTNPGCCECRSTLEEEALAAVREVAYAVKTICISELLPRTAQLLFINLTTLEGATYCIELTEKGWRISSNRQDCMNGDFRQLALYTRYFENIYSLLDSISPLYRESFGGQLSSQLERLLQKQEHDGA